MSSFLIIQTASAGDVILVTPILESLSGKYPGAQIDVLVRNGNEGLFFQHPFVGQVLVWNKNQGKYRNLYFLLKSIRAENYDCVINVQRFAASGLLTVLSAGKKTVGFRKNPFSVFYTYRSEHVITRKGPFLHETERNLKLLEPFGIKGLPVPRLYPSSEDENRVNGYTGRPFITIAPASLWFTKQFPAEKWIDFIREVPEHLVVYLIGSAREKELCEQIASRSAHPHIHILAGALTFLQTAALMKQAHMNYMNDSAPQHLASAVDAPSTVVFCSTVPEFGFGPLSTGSSVVQTREQLDCKPCGLHGRTKCPEGHFKCATTIKTEQLLQRIRL
jgi:heptosyltransferase-2